MNKLIPQTLNDGSVLCFIREAENEESGFALVKLDDSEAMKYATVWWSPKLGSTWAMGHYHDNYKSALEELAIRTAKIFDCFMVHKDVLNNEN